jgi:hypothetical protein
LLSRTPFDSAYCSHLELIRPNERFSRAFAIFRATIRQIIKTVNPATNAILVFITTPMLSNVKAQAHIEVKPLTLALNLSIFLRKVRSCNPTKHRTLQRHYFLMLCLKLGRKKVPYVAVKSPMATYLRINYASGYR